MIFALIGQREYFDERLEELFDKPVNEKNHTRIMDLLTDEFVSETSYCAGLIEGMISQIKLKEIHKLDILEGINNGLRSRHFNVYGGEKRCREIIKANTDLSITYGVDYINKWLMYYDLFGDETSE